MTATHTPEEELARNINTALNRPGVTRKAAYDRLGMTRNTFEKKVQSGGFTIPQIMRIADIAGVRPSALMPESVTSEREDKAAA